MKLLDKIKKNKIKVIIALMTSITIGSLGAFIYNRSNSLNDKVVRFHVLANSDSNLDQGVKIKVKDNVIKYVQPLLKNSKSIDESKEILENNKANIINLANKVLKQNGQTYTARAEIGRFDFPVKSYGDIVFPSGEYDAFRIILGEGEGKNWWCVMFPPLCFVDVKNAVADEEMEKELKKVLTDDELKSITQNKAKDKTKFKLKSLEVLQDIFK
ncbi:stage II sporulation protein R [Clostridium cylindrosporum]|uniref:Stage II sporulation protein R n=1 Tax=Clostridium cylindrosporum DSM 605 TaxID=1121307 RepID=A0A0J8G577_CLOCY|nr:stage II sporulation protein R [Clostridium cylindrosporum]KMT22816.1 stage II sporulation protein R [Clostridium cylindrosporum DSM 605]